MKNIVIETSPSPGKACVKRIYASLIEDLLPEGKLFDHWALSPKPR
jgi:hypothetical protein